MGGNITEQHEPVIREVQSTGTTGTTGTSSQGSNSTNARTTGGTTTGGTTTGGTTTGGTPKTVIPQTADRLSLLTDEERKEWETADETRRKAIEKNARRRQQYAEKKANGGQTVKPRKVRGKQTEPQKTPIDKTSLNMMLLSLSAVIASRPNCEHWMLTEAEVNSITDPLSRMIAESEAFANIGQYSNQIALVMACGTVFIPRLIMTVQKQNEVKKIARTGQQTNTTVSNIGTADVGKQTKSDSKSNRKNDSNPTPNGSNHGAGEPWYGSAISY